MNKVCVNAKDKNYDVIIGRDVLKDIGEIICRIHAPCKCMVITDDIVEPLYFKVVEKSLLLCGFMVHKIVLKNGECSKNMQVLNNTLECMAESLLTRSDLVVALGGGVVGDLAGFASAIYLRGVDFVQIPTTLLAAVDSSVGGKTGVNLRAGKNLVGAFWQPSLVVCDCDALKTLPKIVLDDGISEIIKYAMIKDVKLFEKLYDGKFSTCIENGIEEYIERCVQIKSAIVAKDEMDFGERRLLNFGHTIAHGVEKLSEYKISHGHAVAIGMTVMTSACERNGICEPCLEKLKEILEKYNLPTQCPFDAQSLTNVVSYDKKMMGDKITLIIPQAIGRCVLHTIKADEIKQFIFE